MPCYDNRDECEKDDLKKDVDKLTRLLCSTLTIVQWSMQSPDRDIEGVRHIWSEVQKIPDLREWWSAHQEQDRKRKEQEAAGKSRIASASIPPKRKEKLFR